MGALGACWGPLGGLLESSWGLLGPSWRQLGGNLEAAWRSMAGKMATWRQLGELEPPKSRLGVVMGPSWGAVLEPTWRLLGVKPYVGPVNPCVSGEGRRLGDRCLRLRLKEVCRDLARPCHPVCDRGRRIQPAEQGPSGGLTATYCTQLGMTNEKCNPFHMKSRASGVLLGAPWGPLGAPW